MKPVLIVGSVAYDRIMDFDGNFSEHFMPDKLHSINVSFFVSPPHEAFGGTGGNIAYGLSLLDASAAIIASVGPDFDRYEAWMQEHRIPTHSLTRVDTPTASGYIMTDSADNQIAAFSGGALMHPYNVASIEYPAYSCAIVSPTNKDDMVNTAAGAKAAGIPLFFDPGQQIPMLSGDELRAAIDGATGVFVNDYELALVNEKTGWSEEDIVAKTGFLAVTLGSEGSRIVTKDGEERVRAVAASTFVDPTGAGDAYRSGFIAGFVRELPRATCAKVASTVAAYAVECYGTQNHRFTREELSTRYTDTYQEPFPFMFSPVIAD